MANERLQVIFQDSSDDDNEHVAALDIVPDGENAPPADSTRPHNSNSNGSGGWLLREEGAASTTRTRRGSGCSNNSNTTKSGGGGGGGGWFSNAILRGVKSIVGNHEPSHEPFPVEQVSSTPSTSANGEYDDDGDDDDGSRGRRRRHRHRRRHSRSDSSNWGYGVQDRDPDTSTSSSTDSTLSSSGTLQGRYPRSGEPVDGEENYQINLHEAVLQYLRTPGELYINIILATLMTGSTRVTADVFRAAVGCPLLIKTFLDSDYADVDNPEVQSILQDEMDKVLAGDPYVDDILTADQAGYLRCLCNVKSVRINMRQMVLLRYSGFEYIKMLYDFPHLRADIERKNLWVYALFRVVHMINLAASWFGVLVSLLFTASVIWTAVYWFQTEGQRNNGYWTVICYGAGYVVSLVVSLRVEQSKIRQYENQLWPYPDNNLIIIPAVPVFQLLLVITAVRYELLTDRVRHFIIRYDLRNSTGIHLMAHGICHAIPQSIVQLFLFTERVGGDKHPVESVCFWLLIGSSCASFFMAIFAHIRNSIFSHSCDSFGFAVMFVEADSLQNERKQRIKPSDIATHILQFFTASMLVAAAVTLFIFLVNITNCSLQSKIFISIFVGVIGLSVIAMTTMHIYVHFSRWFGFSCLPVVALMIAYFPFTQAHDQSDAPQPFAELCSLFVYHFSVWIIPLFVTFGCVCVTFLSWLGMVLYEVTTGQRIEQQMVDNYLDE